MGKEHQYLCKVTWTGNRGTGTSGYTEYDRSHDIDIAGKVIIKGSSDSAFRGDPALHNPEDMFLYSLSSCHMLWYLHLCADTGIIVTNYEDQASGTMIESPKGGRFTAVTLHPRVTITDSTRIGEANELHDKANEQCFIANSCNFPVKHEPVCVGEK